MAHAAVSRPVLRDLARLAGLAWEPKVDGVWVELDVAAGAVTAVRGRSGRPVPPRWIAFLSRTTVRVVERRVYTHRRGRPRVERTETRRVTHLATGLPDGTYVAELEAHTERAHRAIRERGHPVLWLRDVTRLGDEDCRPLPSAERRRRLEQACASLTAEGRRFLRLVERRTFGGADAALAWVGSLMAAGGEGVVAHDPAAPYGARRASIKLKAEDTADLQVVRLYRSPRGTWKADLAAAHPIPQPDGSPRLVTVQTVVVPAALVGQLGLGAIVEVRHNGALESGAYRHGRLVIRGRRESRIVAVRDPSDKTEPDALEAVERVTPAEAARRCGVAESTLHAWIAAGLIPGARVGDGSVNLHAVDRARVAGLARRKGQPPARPLAVVEGWHEVAYQTAGPVLVEEAPPEVARPLLALPTLGLFFDARLSA